MSGDTDINTHDDGDRDYNSIFERIAIDDNDVVGLVAYGLYKSAKRDWILKHRERNGRRPDGQQLAYYHDAFVDTDIDRFRIDAKNRLIGFAEVIVDARTPEIEARVRSEGIEAAKAAIILEIGSRTKFWDQVKASCVAWLISIFITAAIVALYNRDIISAAVNRATGG